MISESNEELPLKPGKENWAQWQADHVCELGLFTTLADLDTPPNGIKVDAWKAVQDAIGGEMQKVQLRL